MTTRNPDIICRLGANAIGTDDSKPRPCANCDRPERIPLWYPTDLLAETLEPLCLPCALNRHQTDNCPCLNHPDTIPTPTEPPGPR